MIGRDRRAGPAQRPQQVEIEHVDRPVLQPDDGAVTVLLDADHLASSRSVMSGTLHGMAVSLHHIVVDTHDLPALARFWAKVLDWRILSEREREVVIGADVTASVGVCFMPVPDKKTVKNRLHLDLTPDDDPEAEIERILALGARRVDIGQTGAESWTVLADPEGNEFCVVRPKKTLIG